MSIFSIKKESGEVQAYRILKNSISHILETKNMNEIYVRQE